MTEADKKWEGQRQLNNSKQHRKKHEYTHSLTTAKGSLRPTVLLDGHRTQNDLC